MRRSRVEAIDRRGGPPILASTSHPEDGYRSCFGLLRELRRHETARALAACHRALEIEIGSPTAKSVKAILRRGLDRVDIRLRRCSTVIISQIPTKIWLDRPVQPTLVDVICERLVRNAHVLALASASMREGKGPKGKKIPASGPASPSRWPASGSTGTAPAASRP